MAMRWKQFFIPEKLLSEPKNKTVLYPLAFRISNIGLAFGKKTLFESYVLCKFPMGTKEFSYLTVIFNGNPKCQPVRAPIV